MIIESANWRGVWRSMRHENRFPPLLSRKRLEAEAIGAHKVGMTWRQFWARYFPYIVACDPYDNRAGRRLRRLRRRLRHCVRTGVAPARKERRQEPEWVPSDWRRDSWLRCIRDRLSRHLAAYGLSLRCHSEDMACVVRRGKVLASGTLAELDAKYGDSFQPQRLVNELVKHD